MILGESCSVPWHCFPYAGGQKNRLVISRAAKALLSQRVHFCSQTPILQGWVGSGVCVWGIGIFPSHSARAHIFTVWNSLDLWSDQEIWEWLSHSVTFHVTLGRPLLMNPPPSLKLQLLPIPPHLSEYWDPGHKTTFKAVLFWGETWKNGNIFSLNNFMLLYYCSCCFKMLVFLINAILLSLFSQALLLKGTVLEIW